MTLQRDRLEAALQKRTETEFVTLVRELLDDRLRQLENKLAALLSPTEVLDTSSTMPLALLSDCASASQDRVRWLLVGHVRYLITRGEWLGDQLAASVLHGGC